MIKDISTYNSSIGKIIEPETISYSFNTLGWQIVAIILVVISISIALKYFFRYRKNAYRREAIKGINKAVQEDNINTLQAINTLLKSLCLSLYERTEVASLYGIEWFSFLNTKTNNSMSNEKQYQQFSEAIYSSNHNANSELTKAFIAFSTNWVKKHKA